MNKKNVVIIFGGCSPEYKVSLASACEVISNLDRHLFDSILVGITRRGDWYQYGGDIKHIQNDTWFGVDCRPACLSQSRRKHELIVFNKDDVARLPVDAVFPVLHGRNGEDGTVQGLCELAGIPFVGCGTLASALCMDKDRAHKLVSFAGLRVPRSHVITSNLLEPDMLALAEDIGYPLFVKPMRAGSSYGVVKVYSDSHLVAAAKAAFQFDHFALIEETIPGFEVGCAIIGNEVLFSGEPDEIRIDTDFYDFNAKYNSKESKVRVPARVSKFQRTEIKEVSKQIYRILGCQGYARVDLFLRPDGILIFNEVNTIPGFAPGSRFPRMMDAAGLSIKDLISRLILLGVERNETMKAGPV